MSSRLPVVDCNDCQTNQHYWSKSDWTAVQYSFVLQTFHSTAQCSTVQFSRFSTVLYSTVQCCIVQFSQYSRVWYCPVQLYTVQNSSTLYSTVWYCTGTLYTVQHSMVQKHCTLYSTVFHCTAECNSGDIRQERGQQDRTPGFEHFFSRFRGRLVSSHGTVLHTALAIALHTCLHAYVGFSIA